MREKKKRREGGKKRVRGKGKYRRQSADLVLARKKINCCNSFSLFRLPWMLERHQIQSSKRHRKKSIQGTHAKENRGATMMLKSRRESPQKDYPLVHSSVRLAGTKLTVEWFPTGTSLLLFLEELKFNAKFVKKGGNSLNAFKGK